MKLLILGYNSALPTAHKHATSQLLNVQENYYLLDCGEGTQKQLRKSKARFSKINHIFITHLHGDHVFGLVGLLSTFALLGRTKPLTIFGPKGIRKFISTQLEITQSHHSFELIFKELESKTSEKIYEDKKVEVYTIPLQHRIYCNGYFFKEKPKLRNLNIEAINKYPEIEICDYHLLKQGKDFTFSDGTVIPNSQLTFSKFKPQSYAFCTDTKYIENHPNILNNVEVLYHESTFLEPEKKMAIKTAHSTALDAAKVANKYNAKVLILGHFSNRYSNDELFKEEAQQLFPNVILPKELDWYDFEEITQTTTQTLSQ